ncbi:MAG: hypothetical protein WCP96_11520 [Methylococcaceae bacterium]
MATITYQFAPLSDVVLFDVEMPSTFKTIHAYCLKRLNITGWRIQPADIAKEFKCHIKTAYRALWWFREHGYGIKEDGRWIIYPTPRPPVNTDTEPLEAWTKMSIVEPVLMDKNVQHIDKESFKEKETTTASQLPGQIQLEQKAVVVFEIERQVDTIILPAPVTPDLIEDDVLVYPVQLDKGDLKAAKKHIKKAPLELQQDVLFELLYRITKAKITNPIGYLITLIRESNGDAPIFNYKKDKAFMASINKVPLVIKKPPIETPKVDNNAFFAALINRLGDQARAAIPSGMAGLRGAL